MDIFHDEISARIWSGVLVCACQWMWTRWIRQPAVVRVLPEIQSPHAKHAAFWFLALHSASRLAADTSCPVGIVGCHEVVHSSVCKLLSYIGGEMPPVGQSSRYKKHQKATVAVRYSVKKSLKEALSLSLNCQLFRADIKIFCKSLRFCHIFTTEEWGLRFACMINTLSRSEGWH